MWAHSPAQRQRSERRAALTVVTAFLVAGAAWILLTDLLLYGVVASDKHDVRTEIAASPHIHADRERFALAIRNLIDEAMSTSTSESSLTLSLAIRDRDAEIGLRYRPLHSRRIADAVNGTGELDIAHSVATSIIEAHGGTVRKEAADSGTLAWIRVPAIEGVA